MHNHDVESRRWLLGRSCAVQLPRQSKAGLSVGCLRFTLHNSWRPVKRRSRGRLGNTSDLPAGKVRNLDGEVFDTGRHSIEELE